MNVHWDDLQGAKTKIRKLQHQITTKQNDIESYKKNINKLNLKNDRLNEIIDRLKDYQKSEHNKNRKKMSVKQREYDKLQKQFDNT